MFQDIAFVNLKEGAVLKWEVLSVSNYVGGGRGHKVQSHIANPFVSAANVKGKLFSIFLS
jgi:hypothetical protein